MSQKNGKRLPNIKLTLAQYQRIIDSEPFFVGGEGYLYLSDNKKSLYKFFFNPESSNYIDFPENKLHKIIELYKMSPRNMVKIMSTISVGNIPVGYEMGYDVATIPFNKANLSRDEKIFHLTEAKKVLEYFASLGIVYGDIKSNNILINYRTSEIEFCDIDNIQVGDYPIDLVVSHLVDFEKKYGRIDSVADVYMHNILTLQQLEFSKPFPTMQNVMRKLASGFQPVGFENEGNCIFESMREPENFNGEYAIQYIKK